MLFELRSLPDEKSNPRLFLMQLPFRPKTVRIEPVKTPMALAALEGDMLEMVRPAVEKILGTGKSEDFFRNDRAFVINEESGLRMLIVLLALTGSRRSERLAKAVKPMFEMNLADAEYWFPKLRALSELSPEKAERIRASFFAILDID